MTRALLALLALIAAAAWPAAQAQYTVTEVIPLRHRLVEDVIPILRPLMPEDAALTGMSNQLVVRTTPDNLATIKEVLEKIDTRQRRLIISVRQDVAANLSGSETGVSAHVEAGDLRAGIPGTPGDRRGAGIDYHAGGSGVHVRSLSTRSLDDSSDVHSVQTVEGQPAWIETGASVPLASRSIVTDAHGGYVQDGIEYRDVTSGFFALPRLAGDRVTLEIAPRREQLSPTQGGQIDIQSARTVVSGRLGEWIDLGSSSQNVRHSAGVDLTTTRASGMQRRSTWVKVDELP